MAAPSSDILGQLDERQREAAQSLIGPTCIIAGAGTGKTRTISHRIANGIVSGVFSANRVLALTYTNRAAGELRARLRQLGAGAVSVRTFHAAALAQLEYFWPQLAGVPAPAILESKAKLIAQLALARGISLDAAAIRELAGEIEWRKYSMLSLEQYQQLIQSRPRVAGLSAQINLELQTDYEQAKTKAQKLDWEDVLVLCLGMLRAEPRALAHVQSQYRFFTVDEYQDISPLQHALLDQWLGDRAELCVVGDPNQTIYSFTGASSEFLRNFSQRFPGAKVIELDTNYRSSQGIIRLANRLTSEVGSVELLASSQPGSAPQLESYKSSLAEAEAVVQQIEDLLGSGSQAKDFAVLYRMNYQSEPFEKLLAERGIAFQIRGGERFFARAEIRQAMQLIRAESQSPNQKPAHQALLDILRSVGWQQRKPEADSERWQALNSLLAMLDELPESATLAEFALELADRAHSQHEPVSDAVTLTTIHAAKGLEWQRVFLIGLNEGTLPIGYAKTAAQLQEEKRLFYVGITRAKSALHLSYPLAEGNRSKKPSRFLDLLALAK